MVIFVFVFVLLALVVYYHQSSDTNANHCYQTNNALDKSDTRLLVAREDREEGEGFAVYLEDIEPANRRGLGLLSRNRSRSGFRE